MAKKTENTNMTWLNLQRELTGLITEKLRIEKKISQRCKELLVNNPDVLVDGKYTTNV